MSQDFPAITQSPTSPTADDASKLAALISAAKSGKQAQTDALNRFRAVLMKERRAGTPVRMMTESLAKIGVSISEESLRLWFVRQEKAHTPAPKSMGKTASSKRIAAVVTRFDPLVGAGIGAGPRVARADI